MNKKKTILIITAIILIIILILGIYNHIHSPPTPSSVPANYLTSGRLDTGEYIMVIWNLKNTGYEISNSNYSMRIVEGNNTITEFSNLSTVDQFVVNNVSFIFVDKDSDGEVSEDDYFEIISDRDIGVVIRVSDKSTGDRICSGSMDTSYFNE